MSVDREALRRAREDVATFARLVGWPLQGWQAEALALETRESVILAPRQVGKSQTLAVLACWWGFRSPGQRVLLVSAGEDASRRLLATCRAVCASPLLAGSVVDESTALVTLSNGSEIRSVPASERAIRGWSTDLLLCDEAALVPDDILEGAALPTLAARPDGRAVLASTPWGPSGGFHRRAVAGLDPRNPHTRTFRWSIDAAPWISEAAVAHARETLPPARFQAEFLAEFVGASDLFFDREPVLGAVAPYQLLGPAEARGEPAVAGLDWGRAADQHGIVLLSYLDDAEQNDEPLLFLPWLEVSQRPYREQVERVLALRRRPSAPLVTEWWAGAAPPVDRLPDGSRLYLGRAVNHVRDPRAPEAGGYELVSVLSEQNGVGYAPTEELAARMRGTHVEGVHTSQASKEDAYGRVRALLDSGRLVIPEHDVLIRQLLAVTYAPTPSGRLTIGASGPAADDLADALSLAAVAVGTARLTPGRASTRRDYDAGELLTTPSGLRVPARPRPRRDALRRRGATLVTY